MSRFKEKFEIFGQEIKLIVDTGSTVSVVKKETAKKYGIKTYKELGLVKGKEGEVKLKSGIIGVEKTGEAAPIFAQINGCKTMGVIAIADVQDEVIGTDFLQQIDAIIDMKEEKVIPRKCEPYKI